MRKYECMFLLDSAAAQQDFEELKGRVDKVLERYGAKVIIGGLWDDRKLAYSVKKQRRGAYYLAYVDCPPEAMKQIREDLVFVDGLYRFLVLAMAEDMTVPDVIELPKAPADEDSRDSDRGGKQRRFKRYAKGRCRFTRWGMKYVDWKETTTLARLCTNQGKMFSRKRSGNSARHQRQFKMAVKHARFMALLPYVAQ